MKRWNWQQDDWTDFRWNEEKLIPLEQKFLHQSGTMSGLTKYLSEDETQNFVVEVMTDEAIKTSEIEGEYLNRESVRSSILYNIGLTPHKYPVEPAERGIADMLGDLQKNFSKPLSHKILFNWHKMIVNGRYDLQNIGAYRTHEEPYAVVLGG